MTTARYTIDDIARVAGVSKGTVSRVINGHRTVASSTRQHVQAVMDQLGYAPDPAARHLSWRKGQTLGLSFGRFDPLLSPYHVLLTRALEARTAPQGVQLVNLKSDLSAVRHLPSAVLVMHAQDGDERLDQLTRLGVPAVLIGHREGSFWVAPDDVGGAQLATEQLTAAGHCQLVYLGGGPSQVAQDRERGFRLAASAAGAHALTLDADFTLLGGYRAVRRAWEGGLRFTGLFAQSDESAVGAVAALEDLGVPVPQAVSVVGFDGLPELPLPIELTTVSQDIVRIAECALELMQEAVAGLPARGQHIPVRLMTGATVAPPPHPAP
ncbi:LacI family DNA-binding transcriptional regulator [Deinococcus rubellus]|uniref:LacI family DNA-binding transcriptional regulator n=1 Tax=Deinococcus rubellus TaxID=1889240 RepID=UPI0031E7BB48